MGAILVCLVIGLVFAPSVTVCLLVGGSVIGAFLLVCERARNGGFWS